MRNEIAGYKDCKSIAIMGGTFDPIHNGHLVTAEAVRHRFNVDKVIFIPSGRPAHKKNKIITETEHRYLMAVLATMRNENFEVSRIEIDRPGITYTIDTIEELKSMCRPDVRLYFITGADAIHQIMSWKEPERLLSLCDFVAVTRPGYDRERLNGDIREIREKFTTRIHFMEVPALAISSSDIRERARREEPIKYLLPQAVEDYIRKFCLYQDEEKDEVKFMLELDVMQEKLQSAMSIKRYIHTMGVADEAERLAEIFGTQKDKQKARVAGLLHDCAKDFPPQVRDRFCKEYKVPVDDFMKMVPDLIHPFLGAEVAKRDYLVEDEDILGAIRFHTTGKANMTLLEKIIYIADFIEPNREPFDGLEEARRLAYLDLDMTMKYILEQTIQYVKSRGRELHPFSLEALEYYKDC
ncbi:nicotinate-nucleotide adenylyltransferase [Anaerotignum neopropionicum]|uniref:Probable nicotinate-nucleotide adenylyltransferase n=1 Tax=Anaerotignum neopropionicum TaxID=36847 RepID=A0A136WEE0_9FIRM|nr:nicotinate-nucleotide adenylyltransferase [Anaerotignum neopropionicum]KXL52864.1 nicotinate-nucleotide adenylyltransferase [Anaerotignum neopropionicum]